MKWLVAAGCYRKEVLTDPSAFCAGDSHRPQPHWAWGVVEADSESEAFDRGLEAFDKGALNSQTPGDQLMNWYVVPWKPASVEASASLER